MKGIIFTELVEMIEATFSPELMDELMEREAMLKFIALTQKNARLADEMTQQLSR